jgi:hypothetical protein
MLDYVILCDEEVKLFQHNSGEPLFPFTEFQSCIPSCARAAEDIRHELNRKNCIMEGIERWQQCLRVVKFDTDISFAAGHPDTAGSVSDSSVQQGTKFKAVYCNSKFEFHTNIPYFMELNQCSTLTQPSTSDQIDIVDAERISLNVPRLNSRQQMLTSSITNIIGTHKPTLTLSTVAYAHDIHTLFYYA